MEVKYNRYSEELKKRIREAKPKKGQIVWFESLRPKARGSRVISTDRIWDPWVRKDERGEWEGEYIDIAYIIGQDQRGAKIGDIQYTVVDAGMKGCRGGDPASDALFDYLFLTNQNQSNKEEPWYVPGTKGPVFYMRKPNQAIEKDEQFRSRRRKAEELIEYLEGARLRDYANWFEIKYNTYTQDAEIKKQLYKMADRDPGLITQLDKNTQFRIKTCIMAAERHGILRWDANLSRLLWAKTDSELVSIPPGTNKYVELIKYFETKGIETYYHVEQLVNLEEEKRKVEKNVKAYQIDVKPTVTSDDTETISTAKTVTLPEQPVTVSSGGKGKKVTVKA